MLTLNQATKEARTTLKILVIFLGGLFSLIIIVRGIFALKEIISPTPAPAPTVSFGVLPKIDFPQSTTQQKLTYSINTDSGNLPTFADRVIVNKMVGYPPDILQVDDANNMASSISFPVPGQSLSNINYRWADNSSLQRQLTMNVDTKDFIMTSLFLNDPDVISANNLPGQAGAATEAQSFLSTMSEYPTDIDPTLTTTTLFKIDNGALIPATSLSNTQVIGVNFFQTDVNGLPIYYPNALSSPMTVFVAGGQYQSQVVAADFSHQYVSTVSATYPIKTPAQAFDDLKAGNAFISYYNGGGNIQITNVFLAYYIGDEKQNYLFPIVVFQGSNFYAYVPAILDGWVEK